MQAKVAGKGKNSVVVDHDLIGTVGNRLPPEIAAHQILRQAGRTCFKVEISLSTSSAGIGVAIDTRCTRKCARYAGGIGSQEISRVAAQALA